MTDNTKLLEYLASEEWEVKIKEAMHELFGKQEECFANGHRDEQGTKYEQKRIWRDISSYGYHDHMQCTYCNGHYTQRPPQEAIDEFRRMLRQPMTL